MNMKTTIAILLFCTLSCGVMGCVSTYKHKIIGDVDSGHLEEVYQFNIHTDDFIIKNKIMTKN